MLLNETISNDLRLLLKAAADDHLDEEAYRPICTDLGVCRMYYDMDLGDDNRYRNHRTGRLVMADVEQNNMIMLYDSGEKSDDKLKYTYYYDGIEYVHAYIEFKEDNDKERQEPEVYRFLSDVVYILASRRNMRLMLDHAEITDVLTGIPNMAYIHKKYKVITATVPPQELLVLRINLQNFRYINETAGAKAGDEAIIQYSRKIIHFVREDECVCRMGGDNFCMFIHRDNLDDVAQKLNNVVISHLQNAPNHTYEVSAWIGVSDVTAEQKLNFTARLNQASIACEMGKTRLKTNIVFFSQELEDMIKRGRDIIAMFRPAVRDKEFHPFFQAKVDMRTGELTGFESLCRWIHDGRFIYPDQFIPVLDKEGLIPDLDMAIFRETCASIRKWKDMGLNPPRISSNFSRKNLFVPDIEERILAVIDEYGLDTGDLEVEITESIKDGEQDRLMDFVRHLKKHGLHIAVDDFGTGYSSLSLIHNIDADVIKIDKSFVDEIPGDSKSGVLIESIITIAGKLGMSTIAEGVETAEQGAALLKMGCFHAQGYYYSKPVDFDSATVLISECPFKPIEAK